MQLFQSWTLGRLRSQGSSCLATRGLDDETPLAFAAGLALVGELGSEDVFRADIHGAVAFPAGILGGDCGAEAGWEEAEGGEGKETGGVPG